MTKTIVILGGHGVFGSLIAEELGDLPVVRASRRDGVDVRDRNSIRRAVSVATVVVHAAGPFQARDLTVVEECAAAGAAYVDIADAREYVRAIRSRSWPIPVLSGISTIPCLSGMLLRLIAAKGPAEVAFFIGNRNKKGGGAIASFLAADGDTWSMSFPPPIGPRIVHSLDAPDLDLWPEIRVGVSFELGIVNRAFAMVRRPLAPLASIFPRAGGLLDSWGTERGCLIARAGGHAVWLMAERRGQRMAAIPAATAARMLFEGRITQRGALPPHLWAHPQVLIDAHRSRGYLFSHTATK